MNLDSEQPRGAGTPVPVGEASRCPTGQNALQPGCVLFSAGQIAAALGRTKRAVLLALAGVRSEGEFVVRGQAARAWALCSLPVLMQQAIENEARARGCRNAEAWLRDCGRSAQPVPAAVADSPDVGCARSVFSDLGADLDTYLPERKRLSAADREWAWRETCRHYEAVVGIVPGGKRGTIARGLVEFLLREVPGLVRPGARRPDRALARDFQRKLARFRTLGPQSLRDGREASSGNFRVILCAECWGKALALDVGFRTNLSLAWRTLKESGEMCPKCASRHKLEVQENKSQVPHSIRRAITPLAAVAMPWLKSTAAGRMAGPSIPGDWSDTEPGDVFIGDDVTFNHEVYDFDSSGKLVFFRPECLYLADDKTGYPLAWLLIRGHYNGRHVRRLMSNAIIAYGCPRFGFKFENGVWASHTVRDESRKGWIDMRETADGFKNMGMLFEIRHAQARNPRGKAALECEFNVLQESMQLECGNVGFREREEKSDAIKALRREALAGDKEALEGFNSFDNWAIRLEQIFRKRANDTQNGARNDGVSPAGQWQAAVNRKPLKGLPEDAQWILSRARPRREKPCGAGLGST